LRSWGLAPEVSDFCASGAPQRDASERAAELQHALTDPTVAAVLVTRAGSGAADIVDRLDLRVLEEQPKYFGGFSDVAYLHQAISVQAAVPSFHTPELAWNSRLNDRLSAVSLRRSLMGEPVALYSAGGRRAAVGPSVTGLLRGGNLSILARTYASPPPDEGVVLLLEDLHETPASIGQMLYEVEAHGHTQAVVAVVFGQFEQCGDDREVNDLVRSWAERIVPTCLTGLPVGHGAEQHTVALNWPVTVDVNAAAITPLTAPTSSAVTW
jgi:muramoyltetrapeptide carboxypeptidase